MSIHRRISKWIVVLLAVIIGSSFLAWAEDPCANAQHRALVLSGGGSKGAFEAGAIYHLVVQRHCDFHEFSGVSVGALNGAFLAQAAATDDPAASLSNLAAQSEGLVSLWQSVRGSRDIRKPRRLATMRFGLFGLEGLNDFGPLRRLLDRNISMEKLAGGRPVRTGVVSFWSGGYREVLAQPTLSKQGGQSFMEFLFASSVPPVYGRLPRIPDGSAGDDPRLWSQFSDGGLRHITPVSSYFKICKTALSSAAADGSGQTDCSSNSVFSAPPHKNVQQLFVIVTSPYPRDSDLLPPMDASCCRPGRHQITDGRKLLGRTLALMDDAVYRSDLDFLQFANDLLRWRRETYEHMILNADPNRVSELKQHFAHAPGFSVESYNQDDQDPDAPSLPYEVGLVIPDKEAADPEHLLIITPAIIQEQLYSGCMAADKMMTANFGSASLADQCSARFETPQMQQMTSLNPPANAQSGPTRMSSDSGAPPRLEQE